MKRWMAAGLIGGIFALSQGTAAEIQDPGLLLDVQDPEILPDVQNPENLPDVQDSENLPDVQDPENLLDVQNPENLLDVQDPGLLLDVRELSPASLEGGKEICEIYGTVDSGWRDAVNEQLSILPEEILRTFTEAGWRLYVTDLNLDQAFFGGEFGSVMGCTLYDTQEIFIEDRERAVEESTVHEFGHFVDDYLGGDGFLSDTPEYRNIYAAEVNGFIEGFATSCYMDPKELLAEGLFQYYLDSSALEACAPGLYDYLEDCLAKF